MIRATPINEGQKPTVLGVKMRRLGRPTLALSVPLDGTFYADITTKNTGSAVTKDFLAVFGTYDPATGGFTIKWSHVRTGVGVATGEATNTVNCVAALTGTWDALGAIGTYNAATGTFTIESAVVLEDALTVEKPTPPPPPAKGDLRNPVFPSEVGTTEAWEGTLDGVNVGGSRGRFRFRINTGATDPFYLDPGKGTRLTLSGTGPAEFTIYLERYAAGWVVDDSYRVVIGEKEAPPAPAKGDLRYPSFPSEVGAAESWTGVIYGCNVGGSRGTFRFRMDSSTTGSFGLDPGYCSRCEFSGTGSADFYIYLERYDGGWIVDDSYHVRITEKAKIKTWIMISPNKTSYAVGEMAHLTVGLYDEYGKIIDHSRIVKYRVLRDGWWYFGWNQYGDDTSASFILTQAGTYTITGSFAGDDTYKPSSKTVTITAG